MLLTGSTVVMFLPRDRHLAIVRWAMAEPDGHRLSLWEAHLHANRLDRACARWPFEVRCLQRSLVLVWLLRRRGLQGAMRIGIARPAYGLVAHAWVEAGGVAIGDTGEAGGLLSTLLASAAHRSVRTEAVP